VTSESSESSENKNNSEQPGDNQSTEQFNAPLEKMFDKIVTPFEEFIHRETTSGMLLLGCTIVALLVANSVLFESYQHLLHTHLEVTIGHWDIDKTLHHWINDGLMALFFFVVGLEIKRETLVGELADRRHAMLPIVAAIGGMVVPALIFYTINAGTDSVKGWGIPMATDIAFAVGVMVLLGSRLPKSLLTFLVALAIVDDLGAVVIIALFYTENIVIDALVISGLLLVVLVLFNLVGIRKPLPYFLVGTLLWLAMLKSGVHATLAGVLTALTIPARPKFELSFLSNHVRSLMDRFDRAHKPGENILRNEKQRALLQTLENGVHMAQAPLQRLEHTMHMPVAFLIVPVFALANAGIPIDLSQAGQVINHPVTLGIIAGLVLGKLIGIAGVSWLAVKLGIGELPKGTNFKQIVGVGLLGGIGFTMSIFIGELAFVGQDDFLLMAKTGILFASLIAGVGGLIWLYIHTSPPDRAGK
jgi:NhaA family Na+:H+ antiporter